MREKLISILNDWAKEENDGIRAESLADYLIEHNVIPMPFKKGDIVYWVYGYEIEESTITDILFETEEILGEYEDRLGTDMFLIREEAEACLQKKKEERRKRMLEWEEEQKNYTPKPDKTMKERIAERIEEIYEEAQENKDEKPIEETIADYLINNGAVIIPKESHIYFLNYEERKIENKATDYMYVYNLKKIEKTQDVYFSQDEVREEYKEYIQEGAKNKNRNKDLRSRLIEYIRHGYGQGKDHEDEKAIEETIAEYLINNGVMALRDCQDWIYFVQQSENSKEFKISYTSYIDDYLVRSAREKYQQIFCTKKEAEKGLKNWEDMIKEAKKERKKK